MTQLRLIFSLCVVGMIGLAGSSSAGDSETPDQIEPMQHSQFLEEMLLAQAGDDNRPMRGQGRHRRIADRMPQMRHLEQLRMLKMLELLELTDDQEMPFLSAFNSMRKEQRQLEETGQIVTDSLAQELRDGNASEARINDLVDRALTLQNEKHQKIIEFVEQSRALLTAEQVGKLVIFQKRFESELLERIGRFRRGKPPGPGSLPEDGG